MIYVIFNASMVVWVGTTTNAVRVDQPLMAYTITQPPRGALVIIPSEPSVRDVFRPWQRYNEMLYRQWMLVQGCPRGI